MIKNFILRRRVDKSVSGKPVEKALSLDEGNKAQQLITRRGLDDALRAAVEECWHPGLAFPLIEAGADPKVLTSEDQYRLLVSAILKGALSSVTLLTHSGIDVNAKGAQGYTALIYAAGRRRYQIAEHLVAVGANELDAALRAAVGANDPRMVKLLLSHGADPNSFAEGHYPILRQALENARLAKLPYYYSKDRGPEYLKRASMVICLLVEKGARIDMPGKDGDTPLLMAIRTRDVDVIKYLVKKGRESGSSIDCQDGCGYSALMYATMYGLEDVVKLMVRYGANVNLQNQYGETALIKAVILKRLACIKPLIEAGADPNLANNDGLTARSLASDQQRGYIDRLVAERKATRDGASARLSAAM